MLIERSVNNIKDSQNLLLSNLEFKYYNLDVSFRISKSL